MTTVNGDKLASGGAAQPPPKRPRKLRSVTDFARHQQLREPSAPVTATQLLQQEDDTVPASIVAEPHVEPSVSVSWRGAAVNEEMNIQGRTDDAAEIFAAGKRHHDRRLELAAAQDKERLESSRPAEEIQRLLRSSEDLACDLSLKTGLQLSTSHESFRWLWRIPPAMRSHSATEAIRAAAKEAVLNMCRECLPKLMGHPEKAVKWLERITACLCWYQMDGVAIPNNPRMPTETKELKDEKKQKEQMKAWRKVEEWEEAYRSLEILLRQGLISTFVIMGERFSVTVYGKESSTWKSALTKQTHKPTASAPCAVVFPSTSELRAMLQDNHVPFEVAPFENKDVVQQFANIRPPVQRRDSAASDGGAEGAIVPLAAAAVPMQIDEAAIRSDMQWLGSKGDKVQFDDLNDAVAPLSSALLFNGALRVHALLDVLRQHFLGESLPSEIRRPTKLPRLVAPTPFSRASAQWVEVEKTRTLKSNSSGSSASGEKTHSADLSGVFFPGQVKRLLELLRVVLPGCSCSFSVDQHQNDGINSFTQLGLRRVTAVECVGEQASSNGETIWNWEFKLGA